MNIFVDDYKPMSHIEFEVFIAPSAYLPIMICNYVRFSPQLYTENVMTYEFRGREYQQCIDIDFYAYEIATCKWNTTSIKSDKYYEHMK